MSRTTDKALPREFVEWQVALRDWTARTRSGTPHVGVAPLVVVRRPGVSPGFTAHSIVCGLLPRPDLLETKTKEFRALYESAIAEGARAVYDRGLEYLASYYRRADDFDPCSLTTLLAADSPLTDALRAERECALVFHVLEIGSQVPGGSMRCQQLACSAELLERGPVFDNVWWHNALFHGPADGQLVVHFRHLGTHDTRFGRLERIND